MQSAADGSEYGVGGGRDRGRGCFSAYVAGDVSARSAAPRALCRAGVLLLCLSCVPSAYAIPNSKRPDTQTQPRSASTYLPSASAIARAAGFNGKDALGIGLLHRQLKLDGDASTRTHIIFPLPCGLSSLNSPSYTSQSEEDLQPAPFDHLQHHCRVQQRAA